MSGAGMGTEVLQWHDASVSKPDADSTVLLWFGAAGQDGDGDLPGWEAGWWDGEAWRLAESGGVAADLVTHWAEPCGPDVRGKRAPTAREEL
jgi:hypothetical protein